MTIPSLGGNGGNSLNKIHINNSVPQVNPVEVPQATPTPADELTSVPVAQETVQVQEEVKTEQSTEKKEYSIEQFKADYENMVVNRILPELQQYEGERKKRLTGAVTAAVILAVLAVLIFIFGPNSSGTGKLSGLCIALIFIVWHMLKKNFENKIKKKVLPILMRAIPGFYWQQTPPVTEKDISACKIIPVADKCGKTFDDCFIGEYRKVPVAISECEYEIGGGNNSTTVFQGVVIRIKMNKDFEGLTLIRSKKAYNKDKKDLVKKYKLNEVHLEDPEFEKNYLVFATDQIESRYLITTAFMERLKRIQLAFNAEHISCSFFGDSVYIAPHTGADLFSLCSLVKPVDNHEQFTTLFEEFVSILELVDHFKLDKKLGL